MRVRTEILPSRVPASTSRRVSTDTGEKDLFTLYVNPWPRDPEPSSGAVEADPDLGVVSRLGLYSTGAFAVDEVRIGTTCADVVPVSGNARFHANPGCQDDDHDGDDDHGHGHGH